MLFISLFVLLAEKTCFLPTGAKHFQVIEIISACETFILGLEVESESVDSFLRHVKTPSFCSYRV